MKRISIIIIIALSITKIAAQSPAYTESEIQINPLIDGTLLIPNSKEKPELVIIIAGSGPTDRNGNQNFLKNNNLKKLATALTDKGIATFRYDKRIVKQIRRGNVDLSITFNDFVTDAKSVISYFKATEQYSKIYVAGHSQGSLVGLLASENNTDGFISISGAGQNFGDVIVEQINNTARQFIDDTERVIKTLKAGKTTTDYPAQLGAIFNIETQPFIISWLKYNPTEIISTLEIPILIINGTKDLQVSENEAKLLANANTSATLKLIENMNHVLFIIEGDDLENSKSYNEAFRKISSELIDSIVTFIESNR
ncbi:alpha/beta hydrolase [Winogradskyella immobilis]|uniref:Alpha/beta hydrolase n=1 Tax=Winogradskyella immobilis TaxID=2816852 RepID=A0ABS8EN34_9FLAO|nr:alpha/beta hydrolase [Winogradskyella immobilis]MCC1484515.1 alpha/beta hydrolase [Winogradskyella immobilis]MCG0016607.1 lysophospholipase [Winogradskyella immobilis]